MDTNVRRIDSSLRVLEISATSDELADDVKRAVRKLKRSVQMNGFRPGRVPASLLKRLYRNELTETVREDLVKEVFTDLVLESGSYDLYGEYWPQQMDYDLDEDLHAVVAFNVLPVIDYEALEREVVEVCDFTVNEAMVDLFLEKRLSEFAAMRPLADHETIEYTDTVVCRIREVDESTHAVLIGGYTEKVELKMDDVEEEPYESLTAAALRHRQGDRFYFSAEIEPASEDLDTLEGERFFSARVLEVERPENPELTNEMARVLSDDRFATVEELKAFCHDSLQNIAARYAYDLTVAGIVEKMLKRYSFDIPNVRLVRATMVSDDPPESLALMMRWMIIRAAVDFDRERRELGLEPVGRQMSVYGHIAEEITDKDEAIAQEQRVVGFLLEFFKTTVNHEIPQSIANQLFSDLLR